MTMLHADQSEGASYLDIAQFIQSNGAPDHQEGDLAQLFRRIAFNIAVANHDDDLRNHGFLMTKEGWRLAPAFDVNPNPYKATRILNIDEHDNRPDIQSLVDTACCYGLSDADSQIIVDQVLAALTEWKALAKRMQISSAEVETMASVIMAHENSCPSIAIPFEQSPFR